MAVILSVGVDLAKVWGGWNGTGHQSLVLGGVGLFGPFHEV